MTLAAILLSGFIGLAVLLTLAVLALLDAAVRVWEAASRSDRAARRVVRPQRPPGGLAIDFSSGVGRWAQNG